MLIKIVLVLNCQTCFDTVGAGESEIQAPRQSENFGAGVLQTRLLTSSPLTPAALQAPKPCPTPMFFKPKLLTPSHIIRVLLCEQIKREQFRSQALWKQFHRQWFAKDRGLILFLTKLVTDLAPMANGSDP
eukprot:5608557-Amphidinium_carterae.1